MRVERVTAGVVLALCAAATCAAGSSWRSVSYHSPGMHGKAFTQDVTFTLQARSRVHCSSLCQQHAACLAFTFLPASSTVPTGRTGSAGSTGSAGNCTGHARLLRATSPATPAPGAMTYNRVVECPVSGGFVQSGDLCLRVSAFPDPASRNYREATSLCRQHGGHLAHVTSQADWHVVLQQLKQARNAGHITPGAAVWMGVTYANSVGYTWGDGTPLSADSLWWSNAQPAHQGNKKCVVLQQNNRLCDVNCENNYGGFVCQVDI